MMEIKKKNKKRKIVSWLETDLQQVGGDVKAEVFAVLFLQLHPLVKKHVGAVSLKKKKKHTKNYCCYLFPKKPHIFNFFIHLCF